MTTQPHDRGDELLRHMIECVELLDQRVQVAVERAIAAREAGAQWQTVTDDETSFGRDH